MQRRAVAAYVAIFLLAASVAGVLAVTAETPELTFEDPDFELSEGDTFEVDGIEFTVADISETEEEDELGDIEIERSGVVEWVEETDQTEIWDNESAVEVDGMDWTVHIEGEEPEEFTLIEDLDRQAILEDDPAAANETVEFDDQEYVVITDEDGEEEFVPVDEYFPEPEERTYALGDTFEYADETVTVEEITENDVTIAWTGPEELSQDISQETEVTLGETDFIAYFPDGETLILSSDIEAYEAQLAEVERLEQQGDGLWRIVIIGVLSSLLLVAAAFVPSRY
ncbi:hypothetical protein [Halorubrum vacuolatum]|uniref:Uncharacterized protein n=1 Tax=Halorubrum vacuolatum TaxID=63740 RepID=A0A238YAH4_HALVU|nr:hypothetical protein [Halorubrum vacuolatum]SNR67349.1 hypothetical protein SAMN06264855_13315 [Halorubrum vacuolatum]